MLTLLEHFHNPKGLRQRAFRASSILGPGWIRKVPEDMLTVLGRACSEKAGSIAATDALITPGSTLFG
jgi:hypothetical protein